MKTQGWWVKYGPNKLGVTLPYPISTIPHRLALSLWLCDNAIKRYFAPQLKKMRFWVFFFVLEISFDGIVQNWRTQCQSTCHGRFRGCMIKFNGTPKVFGVIARKNKNWQIFSFLFGQFCFHTNSLRLCPILTKMAPFDLPCLK